MVPTMSFIIMFRRTCCYLCFLMASHARVSLISDHLLVVVAYLWFSSHRCDSSGAVFITGSFIWKEREVETYCRFWHRDNSCWFRTWGHMLRVCSSLNYVVLRIYEIIGE